MKNIRGRGVVVIHAKEDDKVEVERARLAVDVLKMYRIRHVYWEFDGGHDFFPSANNDVLDYLAKHANPTRQAVDFYLDGTAAPTLVHFVSASGQGHLVKTAAEPGRLAVTVSTHGKVKHLDVFFSEDLVDFGTPVAIEVNGTPLTVTPAKSLNAFVTAWTLHPFYDPAEKDRLFLGGCRVMEDGKILEQPRPL